MLLELLRSVVWFKSTRYSFEGVSFRLPAVDSTGYFLVASSTECSSGFCQQLILTTILFTKSLLNSMSSGDLRRLTDLLVVTMLNCLGLILDSFSQILRLLTLSHRIGHQKITGSFLLLLSLAMFQPM